MENARNYLFSTRERIRERKFESRTITQAVEEEHMGSYRPRSFTECLQIFWRRKTIIAFIAIVVLLSAAAVVISIPKVYESRALIVVSGAIYDRQAANGAQVAAVTEQIT